MLRVLPWITDGAVSFLDGFLFNLRKSERIDVFEFGMGNSTLYFLSKNCWVTTVDHDLGWVESVTNTAHQFKVGKRLNAKYVPRPYSVAYERGNYAIVSIDGRDRVACLEQVLTAGIDDSTVLLLDNTERVVDAESRYADYKTLLADFHQIHFEHPCVPGVPPERGNYVDRSGNRVRHRWITTVAFKRGGKMYTTMGNKF